MKVIVLGGAGFLGSYVADELLARGHDVTVFDLKPSLWSAKHKFVQGNILDAPSLDRTIAGADIVYHFAGIADLNRSIDSPHETITVNIIGTLNVLAACREHSVKRFVLASSAYVFSRKGGFYGVSKKSCELLVEEYARQYGIEYTIIRYGSVYGERADSTNRIYRLLRQALSERRIEFAGDGSEEREYIHARDAATLSADILTPEHRNTNVILTGTERFSYRDLLYFIREILNDELDIVFGNEEYKGHYTRTPYSFSPTIGVKLVANPCVDFGQGILECVETLHDQLSMQRIDTPKYASEPEIE